MRPRRSYAPKAFCQDEFSKPQGIIGTQQIQPALLPGSQSDPALQFSVRVSIDSPLFCVLIAVLNYFQSAISLKRKYLWIPALTY